MKNTFAILGIALAFTACTNAKKEEAIKVATIKAVKDSMRLDSFRKADVAEKQQAAKIQEEKRVLMLASAKAAENAPAATMASPRSHSVDHQTTTTTKKKGWSSAALGTVIGAGAGGLGGALIDKKKGRGAIIGGVAGAGAGYLIGRGQDRKSGRVQPKN
ncbi:YMGG-like glycine zipper-containing protein [Pedobacter cryoconitis]|uniref:YmgG-like glycine-zipper protein n=1 Tax=Pedobacter cryoconitis TaxID=188932 RepID=A0A327RXI5_9SPHI|nr:YMGG-like glycine zipper-containing protein [Pedobacter cryoconitis]RAJ21175.1 YmgG-like glycine-zipper protein [Pedobacter cryoconitis]